MTGVLTQLAQPGDRWEVTADAKRLKAGALPLDPSWDMLLEPGEAVVLEGVQGQAVSARYTPERHALVGKALGGLVMADARGTWYLELTSVDPLRFRLLPGDAPALFVRTGQARGSAGRIARGAGERAGASEEAPPAPLPQEVITERGVRLGFSLDDLTVLEQPSVSLRTFDLSRCAAAFATSHGFEQLVSLPLLRDVELYEHQLRTVKTVLRRFRGRALLCDEVGLGKTVEAGMILLELLVRKLVRRVLILTPPSLVEQWQGEMRHKFGLDFITHDDPAFKALGSQAWASFDRILASYHTAKREPHRSAITSQEWDMVIIDEAHHFRNRATLLWKFGGALRKKYVLLLTATPLQNNLEELYNLVTLLHPGLLSTARRFSQQFVDRRDRLTPRNLDQLHALLAEAMVRNRRSTVALRFTRRYAQTFRVTPSPAERELYAGVTRFVKSHLRAGSLSRMALITLQKAMGSSSLAGAPTLERLAQAGHSPADSLVLLSMAERARQQRESAKAARLLALLRDFPDKIVIFTQFLATQEFLYGVLTQAGESVALFHGGLTRLQKEEAIRTFQRDARILLSTESGSEGRNLQFCNAVCNFDLPWNPMRIEQRIGRLSRIGQARDVYVFNLVNTGTIEDDLLYLLEAKVNMFELVIGEMDMVLGNLDEEREFEDVVLDLWAESEDEAQFRQRMEELGNRLATAKATYLRQRELDDRLFGDWFAPEG